MATAVFRARPAGEGRWAVSGMVDGDRRAVTFERDEEPTMEQCEAALRGERVERALREPAPAPVAGGQQAAGAPAPAPAAPPADPDVEALLEGNVAAVSERVATADSRELLERARAAEEADKGRKTAIEAIDARLDELTAAGS